MINSLITSRKNVLPPLFPRALFSCRWRCWSLSCHHLLVEPSSGVACFNIYTVTRSRLLPMGSDTSSIQHSVNETVERFMPGLRLWVRMRDATAQSQICCLQHGETESNVWNTFCMKLPYVAQQVGNAYFYRLTEIKELSGSLWWMHEGSNLLRPVAGCGLFWHVGLAGVVRH